MSAPHLGSSRDQFFAAVESLKLQVDRDTVLQARAALLSEALRLRNALGSSMIEPLGLCGRDPVSEDARDGFNERITALLAHCWQYTDDLQDAAHALGNMASRYGYTEDQITASFTAR